MSDEKTCADCAKFQTPSWIKHELGICQEGMFGQCEASDKNEDICEHFKEKEGE